jgi:hypothetical protein
MPNGGQAHAQSSACPRFCPDRAYGVDRCSPPPILRTYVCLRSFSPAGPRGERESDATVSQSLASQSSAGLRVNHVVCQNNLTCPLRVNGAQDSVHTDRSILLFDSATDCLSWRKRCRGQDELHQRLLANNTQPLVRYHYRVVDLRCTDLHRSSSSLLGMSPKE